MIVKKLIALAVVLITFSYLTFRVLGISIHWEAFLTPVNVIAVGGFFFCVITFIGLTLYNNYVDYISDKAITWETEDSVYLGREQETNAKVHLRQEFRTTHAQVIGTTNAGKTESVILPWAIQDIKNGSGLLIIDGKSDESFLNKLYAYAHKYGRAEDFRLFSLANTEKSYGFDPFQKAKPLEVTERIFSSLEFDNEYFKGIQYVLFSSYMLLFHECGVEPNYRVLLDYLSDEKKTLALIKKVKDPTVYRNVVEFCLLPKVEKEQRTSGLVSQLYQFAVGETSILFNGEKEGIDISEAMQKGQILYFQLPSMYYPNQAKITGKLVLQCLQSAVAKRQMGKGPVGESKDQKKFFGVLLDDFQDYIYEGFGALLNKSRSANVGVVFSHQSMGDLDKVSPAFSNVVLTNTNIKVIMRNHEPATCELFASVFGTQKVFKQTERVSASVLGQEKTGEASMRETNSFVYHPDDIKGLGTGEAVVRIPHEYGAKKFRMKLAMRPDLPEVGLPSPPLMPKKPKPEVPPEDSSQEQIVG